MLSIAGYTIETLVVGHFRLDGGAMFGSVPKVLWERSIPADEKNRIQLASRILLLRSEPKANTDSRTILIDLGMGSKWAEKETGIYAIETTEDFQELKRSVTDVILTHLHFDHAGGVSERNEEGELLLTFPKAKHYVSYKNFTHANNPGIRERASYLKENIEPVSTGDFQLTTDSQELLPGVFVHQVNGHTPGLQYVIIQDEKNTLAYPSDLIPTLHHVPIPYVMGYDLCAQTSMDEKQQFLEQAAVGNWIVVFEHDAQTPAARIEKVDFGKYRALPVTDLFT